METTKTGSRLRAAAAVVVTAALAFTLTACGGDDKDKSQEKDSSSSSGTKDDGGQKVPQADDSKVLATVKASNGVNVIVNSAVRDKDGFVTVSGKVQNGGTEKFLAEGWTAQDTDLKGSVASMGGMMLVDKKGMKRYFVLRDTDHNCLCTVFDNGIEPGKTKDFFAQFPAPPESASEVDLQVPSGGAATLKITNS